MKGENELGTKAPEQDTQGGNKSPAFQFYPKDWLSSSKVQRMPLEAEGLYIRLLAYQWTDGYLSKDEKMLAPLCKISSRKFRKLWTHLEDCFVEIDPGKLINPRLEQERAKQAKHRECRSLSGRKGAASRWKHQANPMDLPEG
jgi:uncharacterized protein YdaU (DUF1376 family)